MLYLLREEGTPREGAGPLPALLLDQGPLPDQLPAAATLAVTRHGSKEDESLSLAKRNGKHVCVPTLVVTG
jgi:hypothetical protein